MNDPKMTEIDAQAIVDEALANEAVKSLSDEVEAQTPVEINLGSAHACWSSITKDGRTKIGIAPTARPAPSMAHELLHARLKIRGYRQYLTTTSLDPRPELLSDIGQALDNELQHHRMYPEFLKMGFSPDQFYHDGDEADFEELRTTIAAISPATHPGELLLTFVTLISPGGSESDEARSEVRRLFDERCGPENARRMAAIEREFEDWRTMSELDAGKTIVAILGHLEKFGRSWIATGMNFPGDGHFVAEAFTREELDAHYKQGQDIAARGASGVDAVTKS
jgi:hypothetical protein